MFTSYSYFINMYIYIYILLNQFDSKSTLFLVKLKILLSVKPLEFHSLPLKFEPLFRYEILDFSGASFIFGEIGRVMNRWPSVLIKY